MFCQQKKGQSALKHLIFKVGAKQNTVNFVENSTVIFYHNFLQKSIFYKKIIKNKKVILHKKSDSVIIFKIKWIYYKSNIIYPKKVKKLQKGSKEVKILLSYKH